MSWCRGCRCAARPPQRAARPSRGEPGECSLLCSWSCCAANTNNKGVPPLPLPYHHHCHKLHATTLPPSSSSHLSRGLVIALLSFLAFLQEEMMEDEQRTSNLGVDASACKLVHELRPPLLILSGGYHSSALQMLEVLQTRPYSAVVRRNSGRGSSLLLGNCWAFNILADCATFATLTAGHS